MTVGNTEMYANELRSMVDDYYNHRISFEEYRQRRNDLLQEFDHSINGNSPETLQEATVDGEPRFIDRIIGMLKKDENEFLSD